MCLQEPEKLVQPFLFLFLREWQENRDSPLIESLGGWAPFRSPLPGRGWVSPAKEPSSLHIMVEAASSPWLRSAGQLVSQHGDTLHGDIHNGLTSLSYHSRDLWVNVILLGRSTYLLTRYCPGAAFPF